MLEQPLFAWDDPARLRELVDANPWATLVSSATGGSPVVSHLPVLTDPATERVVVLGHLARADAELHRLGEVDVVLVVEGANGYISPSFYEAEPYVPTWNFEVAHLHGRPEILDSDETYEVLSATVEHFESQRVEPWRLETVAEYARGIAPYTTGFRIDPDRVVGKSKLSQEKDPVIVARVIAALETDDVHGNPGLAAAMRNRGGVA